MNTAEKIAYTYLRLNGFLLLPQFTVFDGRSHNHIDLIGLRSANSREEVNGYTFPLDGNFFSLAEKIVKSPLETQLGVIAEVKTNDDRDEISGGHQQYAKSFLGEIEAIVKLRFRLSSSIQIDEDGVIQVPVEYAFNWIITRIESMKDNTGSLTKMGSWTWSDEFLADVLVLTKYGFLKSK
jgi:hypothetical protein